MPRRTSIARSWLPFTESSTDWLYHGQIDMERNNRQTHSSPSSKSGNIARSSATCGFTGVSCVGTGCGVGEAADGDVGRGVVAAVSVVGDSIG